MTENPGTESVEELLKLVDRGDYAIPHFQRGFNWQPGMICDLIQSILQDYYTGLLLLWELDRKQAENEAWDAIWGAELDGPPKSAILDGQQRLSSLYYALYNPKEKFPNKQSYYVFTVDLISVLNEEFDGALDYDYYTKNYQTWESLRANRDKWVETGIVPLSILSAKDPLNQNQSYLDSQEFEEWLEKFVNTNRTNLPPHITVHKVYQSLKSILNYNFVYFPLRSDRKLSDICNIFARVNEKGMKLSTFDLLNAFLYPKDVQLRKDLWENLDNEVLKEIDSSMPEYLLKLISLTKQNYCSSKYLYNLIPGEKTTRKDQEGNKYEEVLVENGPEFKKLWHRSCAYAEQAREMIMNTGDADFGAIKTNFIPNTTIIPVLGAILWIYDGDVDQPEFKKYLGKWYWSAVFSEDYSGSSDTVMAKDFRDWKQWLESRTAIERINKINKEYIRDVDLKTVRKGSSRYNSILCLLALNKAPDFFKQREAGTGDYADSRINDHHIFPSKVEGIDPEKSLTFDETKDSIVNRTLLFDKTNGKIKNKKPSDYLDEMIQKHGDEAKVKQLLNKHLISGDTYQYFKADNYDQFILEREQTIKNHLSRNLGLN